MYLGLRLWLDLKYEIKSHVGVESQVGSSIQMFNVELRFGNWTSNVNFKVGSRFGVGVGVRYEVEVEFRVKSQVRVSGWDRGQVSS